VRTSRELRKGCVSPPSTPELFLKYLRALRRRNYIGFSVVVQETGDIAGVVNVSEIVQGVFQSGYLGYYAFHPHAGQGLMREGIRQTINYCFAELKLHRLEANIQPENSRSISIVQSLGFSLEGYSPCYLKICGKWSDHERWAILREQWQSQQER